MICVCTDLAKPIYLGDMLEKYKNQFRIESTRLPCWDYGWNAAYFVTICTARHAFYFGDVLAGIMVLSDIGCFAWRFWYEIPTHFPFVILDAFIVMPNHVHGILVVNKEDCGYAGRDAINGVSTNVIIDDNKRGGFSVDKNPMLHYNLSRIIRWYKGCITYHARKINSNFAWQSRFYDHIIRNEKSFENIADYICDNPRRWSEDKYYEE